ncbi:Xaa-Pro peptidase family protein [Caldibacillus thermolactis]|jgi:Xaa-Pro dipeptidase|uniref:Xaa-Pro peptidase family protein n=1 Tax=Pallidibacillus thermolactis TaxID=251051 RepID=A0ABT2WI96_9BACI|nr:Xaa-Pro peptidase family protein [Pallidibacillus thermolactis]MCU9595280.1 Xaa-Pro peptidase family protein [Pallidibacillus thermolactis]MCU9600654.1 Xaa-Pro peptidase family protein [Pallidibacillus thermolactis subsp. kokeshiiformis]
MKKRLEAFQNWLVEEKIDVAILTSSENVFYYSNFFSDPHERVLAIVLFQNEAPFLVCPQMEVETARAAGFDQTIIGYKDTENAWDKVTAEIDKRVSQVNRVAVEKTHMNMERYEILQKAYPNSQFISAEEKLNQLRTIKDQVEIEKLRKACELADYAIEVGVNAIKEGISELEIVAAIEYEMKKKGVQKMSFETTVLAGAKAASPHGVPGMATVKKGDFVLFDLGIVYEGYCSDITRTVAFGDVSEENRKVYDTVLQAQLAAVEASRPGITCAELDQTARKMISNAGYGEYFTHRLGHGLGISVHEYPSITETNELKLQPGMVYTIEPGIYIPEKVGVRIEDDIVITKDGAEVLTKYPKELQVIS